MAVNDRTASSRQLAACWSTATGVLISASSIRRRQLHHGLRTRVPFYRMSLTANHRQLRLQWALSVEPGKLIGTKWSFQLNRASICGTMMIAFMLNAIPQDNARPHVVKTVRDFGSAQHMQLLPWSGYSPDMSPIENMCDLVGQRLARPAASKDELLLPIQAI
ncbi:transposable element Tcb1 transposase [Trichonephila clavipes]|nr:transposable element Tcb1 transposase [Trichonephila clavipes]